MDQRRGYIFIEVTKKQLNAQFVVVPYVEKDDQAPRQVAFTYHSPSGSRRLIEKGF